MAYPSKNFMNIHQQLPAGKQKDNKPDKFRKRDSLNLVEVIRSLYR